MEDLHERLKKEQKRHREGGRCYVDVLEDLLPFGLDKRQVRELDYSINEILDEGIRKYYRSKHSKFTNYSVVREFAVGSGRYRHLVTSVKEFVPGVGIHLPAAHSGCTLVDGFGDLGFYARLNGALLIGEVVFVVDEIPKILNWNRNYKISYLSGDDFDEYNRLPGVIVSESELERLKSWLDFIIDYKKLIECGAIFIINDRFPDWNFRYSRGSESDKPTQVCFDAHLENFSYSFWYPEIQNQFDVLEMKINNNIDESLKKKISDHIFWLESYGENIFLTFNNIKDSRMTLDHIKANFEILKKSVVSQASIGTAIISSGFVLDGSSLAPNEVFLVRQSEEALAALRGAVSSLARPVFHETEQEYQVYLSDRSREFRDALNALEKTAGKGNFLTGLLDKSREGLLGVVGGGVGAYIGESTLMSITGACAGGMIPVLFNLPRHISNAKSAERLRVAGRLICSAMTK
jgi:hypothetical protein